MAEQNNTSTFIFYIYLLHAVSQENVDIQIPPVRLWPNVSKFITFNCHHEDICINSPSVRLEATTSEEARETLTVDMIPCISDSGRLKPLELKTCRVSCTAATTKIKQRKGSILLPRIIQFVHLTPWTKLWLDLVPQTIGTSLNYPLTGFAQWFWWYGCQCRAILPCKQHMSPLSSTTPSLSSFLLHPWRGSSTTMKLTVRSEQQ